MCHPDRQEKREPAGSKPVSLDCLLRKPASLDAGSSPLIAKQYNQLNHALGSERIETQLIKMAKEHDAMINNSVDLTNEYMKHQLEVKWPKLSMEIQQIQNSMEIIKHTELNRQLDELKMDEEELS